MIKEYIFDFQKWIITDIHYVLSVRSFMLTLLDFKLYYLYLQSSAI